MMTEIKPESVPERRQEIVWRETEGDVFICSPDGETMFTLTGVEADIWRACEGRKSVNAILELLLEAYEVDRATLESDLSEFLADLEKNDLVFFVDAR